MEFIPHHAIFYKNLISKDICNQLINESCDIDEVLYKIIPKRYNGENFVKMGEKEFCVEDKFSPKTWKKEYSPTLYDDEGNCSTLTIYLCCNDLNSGEVCFYSNPKREVNFSDPNAQFFNFLSIAGDAVLFSNQVGFLEKPVEYLEKYFIKIPLFYTCSVPIPKSKHNKRVRFSNVITRCDIRFSLIEDGESSELC